MNKKLKKKLLRKTYEVDTSTHSIDNYYYCVSREIFIRLPQPKRSFGESN
tara:strand:+ start:200 stop:349 length:150 start_codon:yes stop_codon:yes gene_type:complete